MMLCSGELARSWLVVCLVAGVGAGCGGDDDAADGDEGDDGVAMVDAGSDDGDSDGDGSDDGDDADSGGEIDAAVASCPVGDSYPGDLYEATAFEGNPQNDELRFLALNANLEPGALPDRLVAARFYRLDPVGYQTGTFAIPAPGWSISLCADFDPASFRQCARSIEADSGTLVIDQVDGRLAGSLADVVFTDDADPSCRSTIASLAFDQEIVPPGRAR